MNVRETQSSNQETLATLGIKNTGRRQAKLKTKMQHKTKKILKTGYFRSRIRTKWHYLGNAI